MKEIHVADLKNEMEDIVKMVVKSNEKIMVNTKEGKFVMLPEEEYRGLIETLHIKSISGLKEELLERANSPKEDYVSEEEVDL